MANKEDALTERPTRPTRALAGIPASAAADPAFKSAQQSLGASGPPAAGPPAPPPPAPSPQPETETRTTVAYPARKTHNGLTLYPPDAMREVVHVTGERFGLAESIIGEYALEYLYSRETPEAIGAVLRARGHGKRRAKK
jgi:hypothetical protein